MTLYDTSEIIKEYLAKFDDDFIGLTGTNQDIKQIVNKFKVFYQAKKFDPQTNNYELEHSNFVYLINIFKALFA